MNFAGVKASIATYIWSYRHGNSDSWSTHWHRLLQIMTLTGRDIAEGILSLRSMSLVYTTILAFVPLLAVSLSIMKEVGVHEQMEPLLTTLLMPLGEQSIEFSRQIIDFVENMEIGALGVLGLGLLIYTIFSLIQKIESAFNYLWRLKNSQSLVKRAGSYLSVALVGPVLVFSAVGITASLGSNAILSAIIVLPYIGDAVRILGKFLPYLLVIGAFTYFYMLVPNTRVRFGSAIYGAIVAGVMWETTGLLFASFVVGSTSYTIIYSGFAILLMLMIWVYLSWLILLIGANIAFYHQHPEYVRRGGIDIKWHTRGNEQIALQLMLNICRSQDPQLKFESTIENLTRYQQVPVAILDEMLITLENDGLILRSSDDPPRYLPARSIGQIRVIDVLHSRRVNKSTDFADKYCCDQSISCLLANIESSYETGIGELTFADLLAQRARGHQ